MGRGRAKAKQTKVARELKYNTPQTDFDRLQRELGHDTHQPGGGAEPEDDPYAQWADVADDEPETGTGGSRHQ